MSEQMERIDRMLRVVYGDPKFRAQVEWLTEHPSIGWQLEEQLGRGAMEQYVATGRWTDPEQRVRLVQPPPMPDFDWWEPRYDQPGRREQARYRKAGL